MQLKLDGTPACPRCAAKLTPAVVTFRFNIAWCPLCAADITVEDVEIVRAFRHSELIPHSSVTHGLFWYTPRPPIYKAIPVWELLDLSMQLEPEDRPFAPGANSPYTGERD